jgi:hypothetical protein
VIAHQEVGLPLLGRQRRHRSPFASRLLGLP